MMPLVLFFFDDFWHLVELLLVICVTLNGLAAVINAMRSKT